MVGRRESPASLGGGRAWKEGLSLFSCVSSRPRIIGFWVFQRSDQVVVRFPLQPPLPLVRNKNHCYTLRAGVSSLVDGRMMVRNPALTHLHTSRCHQPTNQPTLFDSSREERNDEKKEEEEEQRNSARETRQPTNQPSVECMQIIPNVPLMPCSDLIPDNTI